MHSFFSMSTAKQERFRAGRGEGQRERVRSLGFREDDLKFRVK